MSKYEAKLKSDFFKELHLQLPTYLLLAQASAGAPDKGIVGNGLTSYWEFKHGTPGFTTTGNQTLFAMRLAQQSPCRFVIWQELSNGLKYTMIVHPRQIHERRGWQVKPEYACDGFNHQWLVEQVRRVHGHPR